MECSISVPALDPQSENTSFSAPNTNVSQSPALANQFKPAILQCFGDIAGAIGGHFETYLSVVAQVLQQAAGVRASKCFGLLGCVVSCSMKLLKPIIQVQSSRGLSLTSNLGPDGSYEMFDYVVSLREGIVDAWGGIIGAMKASGKTELLTPYIESIFTLLNAVWLDQNRSDSLMRSSMGVIGYVASEFSH